MSVSVPSITTKRILIVPFDHKHINDNYISWLNDPELMKFSEQRHKKHTKQTCEEYLNSFVDSNNYFLALEDHNGNMIGTMTVYQDLNNGLADMGIMIGSSQARGKGFGTEAWNALSEWVIRVLKPRKLTAGCMSGNKAMIQIMKKSGMQPDGVRSRHYLLNGQEQDIIYMARFIE